MEKKKERGRGNLNKEEERKERELGTKWRNFSRKRERESMRG